MNFLFDIDGTLTPARKPMDSKFKRFFADWISVQRSRGNRVILVTGSEREKTLEQIGTPLWRFVDGSYQNCGNQLYVRGKLIWQSSWRMSPSLHLDIIDLIQRSSWYGTAKNNIEERVGMVNISTVGRDCTDKQRSDYYQWDMINLERTSIADTLRRNHKGVELAIGGEISIDIYEKGKDKSQIIDRIIGKNIFFGNRCEEGGNDHTISMRSEVSHCVENWIETKDILESTYS